MFADFRKRERERETSVWDKHRSAACHRRPDQRCNPQPKCVPWPGIKPAITFFFLVYRTAVQPTESLGQGSVHFKYIVPLSRCLAHYLVEYCLDSSLPSPFGPTLTSCTLDLLFPPGLFTFLPNLHLFCCVAFWIFSVDLPCSLWISPSPVNNLVVKPFIIF